MCINHTTSVQFLTVTILNASPDTCLPGLVPKALLPTKVDVYSEIKVASLNTKPSSEISWSPILSFSNSFVFCGEYYAMLGQESMRFP